MTTSSNNIFLNNILENQFYNGIGVYDSSNNNSIKNNTFIKNGYCGLNIRISSNNIISYNNFSNNNIGIHLPSYENEISNNYFENNNIDIDKELLTPGFLIFPFFISLFILFIYKKLRILNNWLLIFYKNRVFICNINISINHRGYKQYDIITRNQRKGISSS